MPRTQSSSRRATVPATRHTDTTPKHDRKTKRDKEPPQEPPLLVPRRETARLLSCSTDQVRRLEEAGLLDKVRLNKRSPVANVYNKRKQVIALALGEEG